MARTPLSEEGLDRVLASSDPLDRALLRAESISVASDQLRDELVRELRRSAVEAPRGRRGRTREDDAPARVWGPGRRRARRRVALAAAVVAGIAAAVLAVGGLLGAGGREGELGATPASAAVVLDRAASTAMRQPAVNPTATQYEFVKVQEGGLGEAGIGGWSARYWHSDVKEDWYHPNGSGRERIIQTGARFFTPLDASIVRAHGSTLSQLLRFTEPSLDGVMPAGYMRQTGWIDPASLPTESTALLRALERDLRSPYLRKVTPSGVFFEASRLLFESGSPALRAALYRVIAHLPGVKLLGARTDRIGRRGVAVAIANGSRVAEGMVLFDPTTSEVLETDVLAMTPSPGRPSIPAGALTQYTVFLQRALVSSIEELPGGTHQPLPGTQGGSR